jgi:hypothetical protein
VIVLRIHMAINDVLISFNPFAIGELFRWRDRKAGMISR